MGNSVLSDRSAGSGGIVVHHPDEIICQLLVFLGGGEKFRRITTEN